MWLWAAVAALLCVTFTLGWLYGELTPRERYLTTRLIVRVLFAFIVISTTVALLAWVGYMEGA